MAAKKIEEKVADVILERTGGLTIDGVTFEVAPPSPATLILVSEVVATLPKVKLGDNNIMQGILTSAKDWRPVGKVAAILILGAKRIREGRTVEPKRSWWQQLLHLKKTNPIKEVDWLADKVLEEMSPKELMRLVSGRLGSMEMADFFGLTVSLSGANLTKATVEAETASGE